MPRKPRFNLPGIPQHVIQRGNNREPCFRADRDYRRYLRDLLVSSRKYRCRVHAYVLMTNHVHLLVTPDIDFGVSQMMQALGLRYVCYFNRKYERTGTLWEGRYKASLVEADRYFLACMCYIESNPVRAGMVDMAGAYRWSSYHANASGTEDDVIAPHPLYETLGSSADRRLSSYRRFFDRSPEPNTIDEIRATLKHELVLGSSTFRDWIEHSTGRQTRLGKAGRPGGLGK